jgi:ribonuclease E
LRTQGAANITASASPEAALYILNHKRAYLHDIETRYGVTIFVTADEKARGAHFAIERGAEVSVPVAEEPKAVHMDRTHHEDRDEDEGEEISAEGEDKRASRRKRRRRRGRGESAFERGLQTQPAASVSAEGAGAAQAVAEVPPQFEEAAEETGMGEMAAAQAETAPFPEDKDAAAALAGDDRRRNRRRGRRGGRRHRPEAASGAELAQPAREMFVPGLGDQPEVSFDHGFPLAIAYNGTGRKSERALDLENGSQGQQESTTLVELPAVPEAPSLTAAEEPASEAVARKPETVSGPAEPTPALEVEVSAPLQAAPPPAPKPRPVRTGPARKGWWQRKSG